MCTEKWKATVFCFFFFYRLLSDLPNLANNLFPTRIAFENRKPSAEKICMENFAEDSFYGEAILLKRRNTD